MRKAQGFKYHLLEVIEATDEQRVVLEPIVKEFAEKMDSLHRGFRMVRKETVESMHSRLSEHLTEEQKQKLRFFSKRFHGRPPGKKRRGNFFPREKKSDQ